ncbi:DNA polymerase eta-like [Lineus longissimus]|uniref:DNA polymerase eta-like n=1 Tax=Lineus longissimus TaxID=88925 RepID=UPI002B4EFBD9
MDRVVVLVDMDCFYVQVEQRLNPELKGQPCAVVQYNTWKGGGIIAVGYEARACGVTRQMRGDEAKEKCPSIVLCRVPEVRGKADLTRYRQAGAEVIEVLCKFSKCVERASIDEAYIDVTTEVEARMKELAQIEDHQLPNTFVVGWEGDEKDKAKGTPEEQRAMGMRNWLRYLYENREVTYHEQRLTVAAVMVEEIRQAVYTETGFRCSAGVAHNKMLSKLVCGFHKPNRQTVLPQSSVQKLFQTLPVRKIRHLGGKLGVSLVEQLDIEFMDDIRRFSDQQLKQLFGEKTGSWLYEVCRGIENEPVSARQLPKSIGCSKNFRGKTALDTKDKVKHWLGELCGELEERLTKDKEDNCRIAKHVTISIRYMADPQPITASRSCALSTYSGKKIADDAYLLLQKFNTAPVHQMAWTPVIICLGLSAGKFQDSLDSTNANITSFMSQNPNTSAFFGSKMTPSPGVDKKEKRGSLVSLFSQARKSSVTSNVGLDCDSEEDSSEIVPGCSRHEKTSLDESSNMSDGLKTTSVTDKSNSTPKKGKSKSFFASFMARKVGSSGSNCEHSSLDSLGVDNESDPVTVINGAIHSETALKEGASAEDCSETDNDSCLPAKACAALKGDASLNSLENVELASKQQGVSSKKKAKSFFDSYMSRKDNRELSDLEQDVVCEKGCSVLSSDVINTSSLRTNVTCSERGSRGAKISKHVVKDVAPVASISAHIESTGSITDAIDEVDSVRTKSATSVVTLGTDESSNDSVYSAYSVDEIDMGVFDSLPWDIQAEIREFNKRKILEEKKKAKGLKKFFQDGSKSKSVVKICKSVSNNVEKSSAVGRKSDTSDGDLHSIDKGSDSIVVGSQETISNSQVTELSASGVHRKYETPRSKSKSGKNKIQSVPLVVIDDESSNAVLGDEASKNVTIATDEAANSVTIATDEAANTVAIVTDESKCPKCGQMIPAWDLPEHEDYHFALDLQNQTQGPPQQRLMNSSGPIKRKGSTAAQSHSKKAKKGKGIGALDKFFKH